MTSLPPGFSLLLLESMIQLKDPASAGSFFERLPMKLTIALITLLAVAGAALAETEPYPTGPSDNPPTFPPIVGGK